MSKEKKSYELSIELKSGIEKDEIMELVNRAAASVGLYISHIGGFSRVKYPNAVHWHFKRDPKENGLIDATYWDVKSLLWLMVRFREPKWVHDTAPLLQHALQREADLLSQG